ncbi:MAG: hypothetical protein AB1744_04745 [Candidatus Zixiibacteriota bacterium]
MTSAEAIEIIETIVDSLRSNPNQFNLEIKVIGQNIASSGGIGLNLSTTGGGPSSTTIGQVVSVGGNQIEIANKAAIEAMNSQYDALIDALSNIIVELKSSNPNKSRIMSILESLKNTWVPGVITSVLGNVISNCLG